MSEEVEAGAAPEPMESVDAPVVEAAPARASPSLGESPSWSL